jgi:capsular exopolysaccharide synthesis family protein
VNNDYGSPQQEEENIHLGELFAILLRHKFLILGCTVSVAALTLVWIGTRTPIYQAQATLLLEQDEAAGGVLSELASLTSDPQAEAEIALLRSRSLATVTASTPSRPLASDEVFISTAPDFDPFAMGSASSHNGLLTADPSAMEQLGLAVMVERHDLRPFASMYARIAGRSLTDHRLRAHVDGVSKGPDVPSALDVHFIEPSEDSPATRVLISAHDSFVGADDDGGKAFDYISGKRFEALGWELTLWASGEYTGQRYTITRTTEARAVELLMKAVTAEEAGRKTNVVVVRVDDNDPNRAAETANALAKNYIRRSVHIGQQKATRTVRFIEGQLEEQLKALSAAEAEVVRLQTEHPETIAISISATALIEQASAIELQVAQLQLSTKVLQEALALLDKGDLDALSRLGHEVPNLLALGYLEELSTLEAESRRLDRTDTVGYKLLLTTERLRLQSQADEGALRMGLLEETLAAMQAGDDTAIARLGGDPEFNTYLSELAKIDGDLSRLSGSAKRDNPLMVSLRNSRSDLVAQLERQLLGALVGAKSLVDSYRDLAGTYQDSLDAWPEEERATIDSARKALATRVTTSLRSQLAGIESNLEALAEQATNVDQRLGSLPQSELALAEPMRQREARTRIVEFLLSSQQEATITAAATSAAAVLIDPATPPANRIFPVAYMMMLLGTVLGGILGCGIALLHNRLRSAIHTEAELERTLRLPVLGSVPSFTTGRTRVKGAKRKARFVPLFDAPESCQAEAYRQIRASLRLVMNGDKPLRTLASTSSVPGEGKTTTNVDLALAFAETGLKVLLVDADLRKPRIHEIFNIDRSPGMAEAIEGHSDWRENIKKGLMGSLDVLPAGRCRGRAGEVLASPNVGPLLESLSEDYDLVVFDLPPAVVVADVANFANQLDALVLLYRCGGVPGRLLESAADRLRKAGVNLVGVIFNAVVAHSGPGGYGYGYGYGYANSYGEGETSDDFRAAS